MLNCLNTVDFYPANLRVFYMQPKDKACLKLNFKHDLNLNVQPLPIV